MPQIDQLFDEGNDLPVFYLVYLVSNISNIFAHMCLYCALGEILMAQVRACNILCRSEKSRMNYISHHVYVCVCVCLCAYVGKFNWQCIGLDIQYTRENDEFSRQFLHLMEKEAI